MLNAHNHYAVSRDIIKKIIDTHGVHVHETYTIKEHGTLSYSFVCQEQSSSNIHLTFFLEKNAQLNLSMFFFSAKATVSISCVLQGEASYAHITGAYVLAADNIVTIKTQQEHQAPYATSKLMIKGVLRDTALVDYSGMIHVAQNAKGTHASQENKNILLSTAARALSVPQIEVLTDDVHCFHGSAQGRFDDDHMLYAAARGIDKKNTERLLLEGFFSDVCQDSESHQLLQRYI